MSSKRHETSSFPKPKKSSNLQLEKKKRGTIKRENKGKVFTHSVDNENSMKHFNKHVQCLSCLNPQIGQRTKYSKIFTVPSGPKKKDNFLNRKEKAKRNKSGQRRFGLTIKVSVLRSR